MNLFYFNYNIYIIVKIQSCNMSDLENDLLDVIIDFNEKSVCYLYQIDSINLTIVKNMFKNYIDDIIFRDINEETINLTINVDIHDTLQECNVDIWINDNYIEYDIIITNENYKLLETIRTYTLDNKDNCFIERIIK